MMKSVSIWVIGVVWLKSCDAKFWDSAEPEIYYDPIVIRAPNTVAMDFDHCEREINRKAFRYVNHAEARTILLRAAGFSYKENSLLGCVHVLKCLLPVYLGQMKKMLACVDYKFIPITKDDFEEFVITLQTLLTHVDNADLAITKLQEIAEREMKTPEDFIDGFYNISLECTSKVNFRLIQGLRNLGIDPNLYRYKLLQKMIMAKAEKLRDEEIILRARYLFPSRIWYFRNISTPSWITRLPSKLTEGTIWKVIVNRKDYVPVKVLQERLRKCCSEEVLPHQIVRFILSKRSVDSPLIHPGKIELPSRLSESQWKAVFHGMELYRQQDKCLVRSFAIPIQKCEIDLIEKTKGEEMTGTSTQFYIYLKNVHPSYTEIELETLLDNHLQTYSDSRSTIVAVIRLEFMDKLTSYDVLVQFHDENSATNAKNVLQAQKMVLESGETITASLLMEELTQYRYAIV